MTAGLRLFHVTPRINLAAILTEGIVAQIGDRSHACGESLPAVFCFPSRDDCDTALGQWLGEEFEDVPDNGLLILEIALDGQQSIATTYYEVVVLDDIPPECITALYDEAWSLLPPVI